MASSTHSQQPDGLSIIMAAFERHCDDELVQEFGCNLLHNLAFKNVENKQRIADRGCISTIVETSMSNHLGSAKVQIEACRALMSLGFFRPCQDIVQEVGGIEQIFETIDTPSLIHCKSVAKTWRAFAENTLFIRFKRNVCDVFEFEEGIQTEVFKILSHA